MGRQASGQEGDSRTDGCSPYPPPLPHPCPCPCLCLLLTHLRLCVQGDQCLELPPLEQRTFLPERPVQQLADGPGYARGQQHQESHKPGEVGAHLRGGWGTKDTKGCSETWAGCGAGYGAAPALLISPPAQHQLPAALPQLPGSQGSGQAGSPKPKRAGLPAGRIACIPPGAQSPQRRGWQTLQQAGMGGRGQPGSKQCRVNRRAGATHGLVEWAVGGMPIWRCSPKLTTPPQATASHRKPPTHPPHHRMATHPTG